MNMQHDTTSPLAFNSASQLTLQRTYAEVSSEIPHTPDTLEFSEAPNLDMQLNLQNRKSTKWEEAYMVTLTVSIKATVTLSNTDNESKVLFLIEVKQGGIFTIGSQQETALENILNIHCPTILYPYASACVSDLAGRAGFAALHLPAVDFEAMYKEHQSTQMQHD